MNVSGRCQTLGMFKQVVCFVVLSSDTNFFPYERPYHMMDLKFIATSADGTSGRTGTTRVGTKESQAPACFASPHGQLLFVCHRLPRSPPHAKMRSR